MAADALAEAATQAGLAPEELRELLERDAQLALAPPPKRPRADGGSSSGGGSDLPPGWVAAKDPRYNNKTYWYNKATRVTSWTKPEWPQQPLPRQWGDPTALRPPQAQAALPQGGGSGQGGSYGPSYGSVAGQPPRAGYTPPRGTGYGGIVPETGPRIEALLDAWVSAKRGKDFATADSIRSELRAVGVDPDTERPGHSSVRTGQPKPHKIPAIIKLLPGDPLEPWLAELLETWARAKREKDYDRADEP